jgi:hypothetical protein
MSWWDEKWGRDAKCAICLGRLRPISKKKKSLNPNADPPVVTLDCKHRLHITCYTRLLEKSDRCPLCRAYLTKLKEDI